MQLSENRHYIRVANLTEIPEETILKLDLLGNNIDEKKLNLLEYNYIQINTDSNNSNPKELIHEIFQIEDSKILTDKQFLNQMNIMWVLFVMENDFV